MLLLMKCMLLLWTGLLGWNLHLPARNLDSLLRVVHDRDQAVRAEVIRLSQQTPPAVDSLRNAMELEPIETYLRMVEAVYGIPCRWDPTLSVERIEALRSEP